MVCLEKREFILNKNILNFIWNYQIKEMYLRYFAWQFAGKEYYKENFPTEDGSLPITEKISNQVLTLPMYPNMTNEEKKDMFYEGVHNYTKYKLIEMLIDRYNNDKINRALFFNIK